MKNKVQQDMMRPKSAMFYIDSIQEVAGEFVDFVRTRLDSDGVNRGDFLKDCQSFAFESSCLIALDYKLGAFKPENREHVKEIMKNNDLLIELFPKLAFGLPTWMIFPPRYLMSYFFTVSIFDEVVLSKKVEQDFLHRGRRRASRSRIHQGAGKGALTISKFETRHFYSFMFALFVDQ